MSIVIISAKPSFVRELLPVFRARYPDEILDFPVILLRGYYHLPLPRGETWRNYPLIVPMGNLAAYTSSAQELLWGEPQVFRSVPGEPWPTRGTPLPRRLGAEVYEAALTQAHTAYVAVDPSPGDSWAAEFLRQRFMPSDRPFYPLTLVSLDRRTVIQALQQAHAHPTEHQAGFADLAQAGQVKAYFDHQFRVNSLSILGRTFGQPGQPGPWVSKYQVLALYTLAAMGPSSLGQVYQAFDRWEGSGKYPNPVGWVSLGGASSRPLILEQLRAHGWISIKGVHTDTHRHRIVVTEAGHAALAKLHPDCHDPDLPFRVHRWMEAGMLASQPAMDRYIRTFFGKQKRFLERPQVR